MRLAHLVIAMTLLPGSPDAAPPRHGDPHHNHGNPTDLDEYVRRLEEPSRAEWQKPDEVVAALAVKPGMTACDVGAGSGYFSFRLSAAVGPEGRVFAVDVEPRMLGELRERLRKSGRANVTPVLGDSADPLLPRSACDLILVVNTFHHFPDGVAYLKRLAASLKPGGRIANIDFHKRPLPFGPPVEHKIAREAFVETAARAGLELVGEQGFLPHQYFLVFRPRP